MEYFWLSIVIFYPDIYKYRSIVNKAVSTKTNPLIHDFW